MPSRITWPTDRERLVLAKLTHEWQRVQVIAESIGKSEEYCRLALRKFILMGEAERRIVKQQSIGKRGRRGHLTMEYRLKEEEHADISE